MDAFQREIKQWLKEEMKKYHITPKKLREQEQRIMESGLFELKPHRSGYLLVFKKEGEIDEER